MKIVILLLAVSAIQIAPQECVGKKKVRLEKGLTMHCHGGVWKAVQRKSATKPCEDELSANGTCSAERGHCQQFTTKGSEMDRSCPGTCNSCDACKCQDSDQWHQYCSYWTQYCQDPGMLGTWMTSNCRKTCGKCRCPCCSFEGKQHALGARISLPKQCGVLECQESLIAGASTLLPGAKDHEVSHPEELTLNFLSLQDGADCCILPEKARGADGTEYDKGAMVEEGWGGSILIPKGPVQAHCCHGTLSVALEDVGSFSSYKTTRFSTTSTSTTSSIPGIMLNPVVLLTGGLNWQSVEVYSPLGNCNKDLEDIPHKFIDHSSNFFNGEIIICGGQQSSSRCLVLDQNQRFIHHSKMLERHIYHVGAVVSDTLIIVGGQALPDQGHNTVETWNGARWEKSSFDEVKDMRTDSCIDAISKDTLLMVGGVGVGKLTNKLMKYYKADKDQDGVWEQLEDFPGPASYGLGCAFIKTPEGDSFLIAGGRGNGYQDSSYLYNIQKNTWEEVGRLSHVRLKGKIVVVDGKVLMLGGSGAPTTVEEYNVESKTWSKIEQRIKQARAQFDAVVVPGALVGC